MNAAPIKVLVIDDEPPIRKLLRVGLSTQGYDILKRSWIRLTPETPFVSASAERGTERGHPRRPAPACLPTEVNTLRIKFLTG